MSPLSANTQRQPKGSASRATAVRSLMTVSFFSLLIAFCGLLGGVLVEGIVSSFHYDGSLTPWPRCRSCGRHASPLALVPLAGRLLWARRCPACDRPQVRRALEVEAVTAAAFFLLSTQYTGYPLQLAIGLVEAALLVAVLFIDVELRLIPTFLILILSALGLVSAATLPSLGLTSALEGGAIGFGAFGLLFVAARLVFGPGAFGLGDAYLAGAIGAITGYPGVVFTLALGVFLGGIGAILVLLAGAVARGRRAGLRATIPYGPYLVVGVLYVLARGNTLAPLVHL